MGQHRAATSCAVRRRCSSTSTVGRTLPVGSRQRLEVRWEVYNALNTPVFANPASTFAANGYRHGRPDHLDDRRPADDAAGRAVHVLMRITMALQPPGRAGRCRRGRLPRGRRSALAGRRPTPTRGVTDPGVITTGRPSRRPACRACSTGASTAWPSAPPTTSSGCSRGGTKPRGREVYRLDWLENASRGSWELDGDAGAAGTGVRPRAQEPAGRHHRSGERGRQPRRAARCSCCGTTARAFVPLAADLGLHLAGGAGARRAAARRGRAVVPLVFDNALADPRCRDRPARSARSRPAAWRRSAR